MKVEQAQKTLANTKSKDEDVETAKTYLTECLKTLVSATPVLEAINDDVRKIVDEAYVQTLGGENEWKYFGQTVEEWTGPYEQYVLDVVDRLKDTVGKWSKKPEMSDAPENIKRAWDDCGSKAQLVLGIMDDPDLVPFMSSSVWRSLAKLLGRVSRSVLEVRLFTMTYLFGRNPGSVSLCGIFFYRKHTHTLVCGETTTSFCRKHTHMSICGEITTPFYRKRTHMSICGETWFSF